MDFKHTYIARRKIFANKLRYKTCHPYFGLPSLWQVLRAKKHNFKEIASDLNDVSVIEYKEFNDRPVVSFCANIKGTYKAEKYMTERIWARNYIIEKLEQLWLIPDLNISTTTPPVVYVPLDNKHNLKQMSNIARYFAFEQYSMLTRAVVKKLKTKIR